MAQKKSFIFRIPYFLATDAGSLPVKLLFASCYLMWVLSYVIPFAGAVFAFTYNITVWQFFNIKFKDDNKYAVYSSFLFQRNVFNCVFVFVIFLICVQQGGFSAQIWHACLILVLISITDILLTLKGIVGIGYIYDKKNKN